jgi:hypothetical protein
VSEMFTATDRREQRRCSECDQDVSWRLSIGCSFGTEHWMPEAHNARCGLPCFGAGVRGKVYRSGLFHRSNTECHTCCANHVPPIDLAKLRELLANASPRPWFNGSDPSHFDAPEITDRRTFAYYVNKDPDAALIAAGINALPELVAIAEAACDFAEDAHAGRALLAAVHALRTKGRR